MYIREVHLGSQEEIQAGAGQGGRHDDEFVSLPAKFKVTVGYTVENAQ